MNKSTVLSTYCGFNTGFFISRDVPDHPLILTFQMTAIIEFRHVTYLKYIHFS